MIDFNIYTLGGGAYMNGIFNGVALITQNGSYITLMKMAMTVGLLATLGRSAYKGALWDWQWFLGASMLYLAAMAPTATVIVTDKLNAANSSVVNNVPIGLAATAGIADEVGWWLADEFDTVFSMPADLTYDQHGLLFGNALVDQAMSAQIADPRTAANLSEFFQQCVFYDVLLGRYSMTDLQNTPDMWGFIQSHTSQVRMFSYEPPSGAPQVEVCNQSARTGGDLDTDIQAAIPAAINILGVASCPLCDRNTAINNYSNFLPEAVTYMTSLSQSASKTLLQTMMGNAMQNGIQEWASRANAPAAAVAYSSAVAQAQQQTTWATMGYLAEQYLPIADDLLKAILYAAFPLVFLLVLLPGGWRAALAYGKGLVWIQLWSPLFAVLHFIMSSVGAQRAMGVVSLGNGGASLTAMTYNGLGHVMSEFSIMAGYCTVLIPVIAWAMLAGLSSAVSAVGGIIQSYQSPAAQAAGEATRGNLALGNSSLLNSSRWQQNDSPTMNYGNGTITGPDGVAYGYTQKGTFAKMPQSQLPISVGLEQSVRSSVDHQTSEAVREARANSVTAAQGVSSSMAEIDQLNHQLSTNKAFSDSVSRESASSFQQHVSTMNSIADELRKNTTLSRAEVAQAILSGGGGVSGSLGLSAAGSGVKAGADFSATMQMQGQAGKQELLDRATKTGLDKRFGEEYAASLRAGQNVTSSYGGGEMEGYAKDASSRFSRDASVVSQATASVEHARAFQTARSLTESEGFGSQVALQDRFKNWLTQKLGENQQAAIELIHAGAQTGNTAAYADLSRHMHEFSKQFASDIAQHVGPLSGASVEANGASAMLDAHTAGARAVDALHGSNASRIASKAGIRHLTDADVESKIEANRAQGAHTQQDLQLKEAHGSASAATDEFVATQEAKQDENYDTNVPLTLQAMGEAKDAGSRPLIVGQPGSSAHLDPTRPSEAGHVRKDKSDSDGVKVEWPTLPPDAR